LRCVVRLIVHVVLVTSVADPFVSIELAGGKPMFAQRTSRPDSDRTGDEGRRCPERVRGVSSRRRRHRPGVECLEDRRVPSAVTEFPLPDSYIEYSSLTAGPDGNLWFVDSAEIARMTPAGAITDFPLPANYTYPIYSLTAGPDGNVWFTVNLNQSGAPTGAVITRITPAGALAAFPLPAGGNGYPGGLTAGPDGNLWILRESPGAIVRITPAGALTEFPLPADHDFGPNGAPMTAGPDGNLWFSEYAAAVPEIGRITPAGAFTEFPLPAGYGPPSSLTAGPDGNLWFSDYSVSGPEIGRITPAGALTEFPLPAGYGPPSSLTAGPDGNLWFSEQPPGARSPGAIVRITPSGALAAFPLPPGYGPLSSSWQPPGYGPQSSLTAGPDGNLWFSEQPPGFNSSAAIVRITPSGAFTKFSLPSRHASTGGLTVGRDGNLWFVELFEGSKPARIARIDPTPPRVTGVVAARHPGKAITSILVGFDGALDPVSASRGRSYGLAAGVASGPTTVFSQPVKIARVSYDRSAHAVRLKLAVPQKGPVRVTVRAGLEAADGMSSPSDFTAVIA
jgi:virginiamycin B lyase